MQKENTPPHIAQTELHLQCGEWAPCQIQQDSCCTFIPHNFFREQQWQYSSPSCLFTALYMHLPAFTGLLQISTLFIFPEGRAHRISELGTAASLTAGPVLLSWACWCCRPWCRADFPAHFPWHCRASNKPPEELHAARPQSYPDPQGRSESQPWGEPLGLDSLTSRTHHPQIWKRTELDQEALAVPTLKLGCTHTWPTLKLSFSAVSAGCSLFSSHSTFTLVPSGWAPLFLAQAPLCSPEGPWNRLQYKHSCICTLQGI